LVGRRDIRTCYPYLSGSTQDVGKKVAAGAFNGFSNMTKCIGHLNDWSIFVSRLQQYAVSSSGIVKMDFPYNFGVTGTGSRVFQQLEGFFKYNFINYWLSLSLHEVSGISMRLR